MNIHIVIDDLSSMILNGINAILKEFREKDCISMIGELEPNKTRKRKCHYGKECDNCGLNKYQNISNNVII